MRTKVYYSFIENKKEIRKCKMHVRKEENLNRYTISRCNCILIMWFFLSLHWFPLVSFNQEFLFKSLQLKSNFAQQHPHIKTGMTAKRWDSILMKVATRSITLAVSYFKIVLLWMFFSLCKLNCRSRN